MKSGDPQSRGCSKHDQFILWSFLLVHGLLIGRTAALEAPVFDEVAHLPSGLIHWMSCDFAPYRVNPPLMRMIASFSLLAPNAKVGVEGVFDGPFARSEFTLARRFLLENGSDSMWFVTFGRWAQIPVCMFGGWICYQWSKELFGIASARIALLLWCFCPNLLAWGSTITPDMGAAAFGALAGYSYWRWLKDPSWSRAVAAALGLGVAELTKSTWIVLFILWPVIWLMWRIGFRTLVIRAQPTFGQLAAILGLALYVLNLGYGFEATLRPLGEFEFISRSLGGENAHSTPGNRFRGTALERFPVPVPANYLKGIDVQKFDFEKGKWSYLRGEQKPGGWYHYYLYALAVKTPLGTLFLGALSVILAVCQPRYRRSLFDELVLLAPAAVVIVLVSSQTGFNRYLRYVLPAVPFLYIAISRVGQAFDTSQPMLQSVCMVGLISSIIGSLSVFPHSMSYFNLAAGGPVGGPSHLLDANIDWGQDLLELKRFVDRHPEVGKIRLAYFGFLDPKLAQFEFDPVVNDIEDNENIEPGWYAISVNLLYGYRHSGTEQPDYARFRKLVPYAMAGYSIYIYRVTAVSDPAGPIPQPIAS